MKHIKCAKILLEIKQEMLFNINTSSIKHKEFNTVYVHYYSTSNYSTYNSGHMYFTYREIISVSRDLKKITR